VRVGVHFQGVSAPFFWATPSANSEPFKTGGPVVGDDFGDFFFSIGKFLQFFLLLLLVVERRGVTS